MPKYIEREALLRKFNHDDMENDGHDFVHLNVARKAIEEAPAADVAAVVHGEWLNFTGDFSTAECNQCGELYEVSPDEKPCEDFFSAFKKFYKFCPNCGAKMDKEDET